MTNDLNPKNKASGKDLKVLNRQVYYDGDTIVRQGDSGHRAFYVESGQVEVFVNDGKTKLKVAQLEEGAIFGEMALITHEPRTASVKAKDTCTITIIEREEIEGKIERIEDKAIKALIYVLVERLRETTQGQLEQYKSLEEFQDRVTGLVDRVHVGIDSTHRDQFRKDVTPLLEDLQEVLDRYQK